MKNQKHKHFAALIVLALVITVPYIALGQQQPLATAFPFSHGSAQYLGPLNLTGRSGLLYDLQPSIMYDEDDIPSRRFKMWWHGQNPGVDPGDAIYFAHSSDGQNWTDPQLVLTPQLGTRGEHWADDHLMGAMSVIKIGNKYYMFYEAVGTLVVPINRFFNFAAGDTWATHGRPQDAGVIDLQNDSWERALGVAWAYNKAYSAADVSHPIYAGEVIHSDGKRDRFLSRTPITAHTDASGSVFSSMYRINNDPSLGTAPVFFLFPTDGGDRCRKPIYEFFDPVHRNTYVTDDIDGEGVPGAVFNEFLGYAATDLETVDMKRANQNQVMMATSTDGINFTRCRGAGDGFSVASPLEAYTNLFNFNATGANGLTRHAFEGAVGSTRHWDIFPAYGSGFPAALVRDGNLELFFTDDSLETPPVPIVPQRMFRIPISEIENPQAYLDAGPAREPVYYGQDVKWSPLFRRYFYTNFLDDPTNPNRWSPEVQWSDLSGNGLGGNRSTFDELLPTFSAAPRGGGQGGLAGTPLGHTLDFPDDPIPHTAFHLYYAASDDPALISEVHNKDLDHVLVFGFPDEFAIAGDFDTDGDVDCDDLDGYVDNLGMAATGALAALDFDGDGFLSQTDGDSVITTLIQTSNGVVGTFPGDLNCDGQVNVLGDAFALVANLGTDVSSYSQGDINFDGTVNVLGDAFVMVGNLGNTNAP